MSRDRGWHAALRQAGLPQERDPDAWYPEARRARISAARQQAREGKRRRAFRYGLVALAMLVMLAALTAWIAAVIIAAVH